jgi:hypothetical protein
MNYLFFYYGEIPKYVGLALNNILNIDKDADIYLATDQKIECKNINILNIQETFLVDKLNDLNENFENLNKNSNSNPLWATSLLRIYALKELKDQFKINSFIHFDTDVIIYKSFSEISKNYDFLNSNISITQNDFMNLVFGYSFFPNKKSINDLVNKLDKNLLNIETLQNIYARGAEIPEMRHLGILNLMYKGMFSMLPTLPHENRNIIFDPAGYGQYLNGTHLKRGNYIFKRRWISMNHIVGSELKSKRIECKFNKSPFVIHQNRTTELANLHIHSKNISKFLPKKQKNYINL